MTGHDPIYSCLLCEKQAIGGDDNSIDSIYAKGGVLIKKWSAHSGLAGSALYGDTYICNGCIETRSLYDFIDAAWQRAWNSVGPSE